MQIVRTIVWVVLLVLLLGFSFFNWKPVEVQIWDNLIVETKVPALVIVSFLLGLVPMWLIHRGSLWRHRRRISALESSQRAAVNAISTPAAAPPAATTAAPVATVADEPLAPEPPVPGAPKPKDEILK